MSSLTTTSHQSIESAARLLQVIDRFADRRILVMGDFIADEFIYGRVARISREAPVLILEYDMTQVVPGGAGNAANNVAALGARTRAVGLVGDDEMGRRMMEALHGNVERQGMITRRGLQTPTKTRILAGGVHSAKQQVVRIDRATRDTADETTRALFRRQALRAAERCDAVLVSDYGAGLVSPALVTEVKRAIDLRVNVNHARPNHASRSGRAGAGTGSAAASGQSASRASRVAAAAVSATRRTRMDRQRSVPPIAPVAVRQRVPILIDSRYELARYRGLTACTPNEAEVEALLGIQLNEHPEMLERAGRTLLDRTRNEIVLVTRGSHGMALFERGQPTQHIDIYGSDEISDVTGAGDTVIATMTLALAAGASAIEAAQLANYAGGIVVMKRGTATVTADELRQAVRDDLQIA